VNNLMWVIRYKIYHQLSEEEVINYTLPFGYRVRDEDVRAIAAGADLLISGELRYHAGQEAEASGICLVEVGHDVSERVVLPSWRNRLQGSLDRRGIKLPLHLSELPTTPWERFSLA